MQHIMYIYIYLAISIPDTLWILQIIIKKQCMDNYIYIYIYMIIKGCVSTCHFISAWVQDLLTALDLKGQVFIVFPGYACK